jgi:hypothetical protein
MVASGGEAQRDDSRASKRARLRSLVGSAVASLTRVRASSHPALEAGADSPRAPPHFLDDVLLGVDAADASRMPRATAPRAPSEAVLR